MLSGTPPQQWQERYGRKKNLSITHIDVLDKRSPGKKIGVKGVKEKSSKNRGQFNLTPLPLHCLCIAFALPLCLWTPLPLQLPLMLLLEALFGFIL
ncbi:MAG: hypothetical protein WA146_14945 [Thiobacillus sp.]